MEGVPALPWAGDAGGRIILPKAVTYEQLAAGAVEFQLYNRQTNALIPTDILRVGDHIEIREKETGGDESPYTIDRYDGARSEIVLTGDGQATRIWGLMGASFNDSVHSVRTFFITREIAGDTHKLVNVEVDGKMYIPFVKEGNENVPIGMNDGEFYPDLDFSVGGLETVFPFIEVVIENSQSQGDGYALKIPSIDNITTLANDAIEVIYDGEYEENTPWKYGQDGIFNTFRGNFIRVNGVNRLITIENRAASIANLKASLGQTGGNIYTVNNATLKMEVAPEWDIETAKQNMLDNWGLEFGEDIIVSESIDMDVIQPFIFFN